MNRKIFIGNLPWQLSGERLAELFGQFGQMLECVVMQDSRGRSRGYGFITYAHYESAFSAVKTMHGEWLQGRRINVSESVNLPKERSLSKGSPIDGAADEVCC